MFYDLKLDMYQNPKLGNKKYRRGIRDGFKKSKWKFKMAFAMKGAGHNGRTVAPEAILFESPCRAHPET